MNQLVIASPSDTTPPSRVIPGASLGLLTFDFTMVLAPSEVLTSVSLSFSDSSLIALNSTSIQSKMVQFLVLTSMADGLICRCSCAVGTSAGRGDARSIRLVAYDSGVSSTVAPISPYMLTSSELITPGVINDGTTKTIGTIPVTGANDVNSFVGISVRDAMPGYIVTGKVTTPGVVTVYVFNDFGGTQTLPENLYTATVFLA